MYVYTYTASVSARSDVPPSFSTLRDAKEALLGKVNEAPGRSGRRAAMRPCGNLG